MYKILKDINDPYIQNYNTKLMDDKKDKFIILLPWMFLSSAILLSICIVWTLYQRGNRYLDSSEEIYALVLFFLVIATLYTYVYPAQNASLRLWKKYNC